MAAEGARAAAGARRVELFRHRRGPKHADRAARRQAAHAEGGWPGS